MKKILYSLILMLSAFVSAGAQTSAEVEQVLHEPQVSYHDALLAKGWRDGWFVGVNGGVNSFIACPRACGDVFDLVEPQFGGYAGKWFTDHVGARAAFTAFQMKNARLVTQKGWHAHGDILYNVVGRGRFGLSPFFGLGLMHNIDSKRSRFAISYGIMASYAIAPRLAVTLELSNAMSFNNIDGYGCGKRFGGDNMLAVSAGLSFTFGRTPPRRIVDARPVMVDNARLRETLAKVYKERSRQSVKSSECDSRGVNDYDGLNKLRARLNNGDQRGGVSGEVVADKPSVAASGQSEFSVSESCKLVAAPLYIFFDLASTNLTDPSQLVNLREIARLAVEHELTVKVTGSADSATGSEIINHD